MRRILVPLDGNNLSASILPDARRLAGPDGELVLIRDASVSAYYGAAAIDEQNLAIQEADDDLVLQARALRQDGVDVRTQTFVMGSAIRAIDEAITMFKPDMVACATHGRTGLQRLWRGSVAWAALAHSPIPVLLRHPAESERKLPLWSPLTQRRILVPLDGSSLTEAALPLATRLAMEWHVPLVLVKVVANAPNVPSMPIGLITPAEYDWGVDAKAASAYLHSVADRLPGDIQTCVYEGVTVEALARAISDLSITDIVLASHGRTGLSRVILGSIADELIHRLHCPIVVVPALAAAEPAAASQEGRVALGV